MFGETLKLLRRNRGISRRELAAVIGKSEATVSAYEQNRKSPSLETLVSIADYFSVTTDYLLGRNSDTGEKPLELEEVLSRAHLYYRGASIPREDREAIEDAIGLVVRISQVKNSRN
jgi:transcriptional regulator with XRE-family HTH domain